MKAVLLSAGLGTRLGEITKELPKCLVKVKGKPILDHWLEKLTEAGCGSILVNTHYFADKVSQHISDSHFANRVVISHEEKLLGTAGTLLSNVDFFQGENVLFVHCDNYSDIQIDELIARHNERPPECVMTMAIFQTQQPWLCGVVDVDERGILRDYTEKPQISDLTMANAAVIVISWEAVTQILELVPKPFDFSADVLPLFKNRIFTYTISGQHIDIGTVDNLGRANELKSFRPS